MLSGLSLPNKLVHKYDLDEEYVNIHETVLRLNHRLPRKHFFIFNI